MQALYQGVLTAVVSIALYGRAISLLGASAAGAFVALGPVIAAVISIPILGEMPSTAEWVAIMSISVGVYFASGSRARVGTPRRSGGERVASEVAMPFIARTPEPPYYAVIFTSINADMDHDEHTLTYRRLVTVAASYNGFLGIEPARNADGSGVAAIYWTDLQSIAAFARDPEHMVAKKEGREVWYSHYMIRICRVEREYGRSDE